MVSMQCNQPTLRLPEAVVLVSVSLLLLLPVGRKCPLLQTHFKAAGRILENSKFSYYVVILEN